MRIAAQSVIILKNRSVFIIIWAKISKQPVRLGNINCFNGPRQLMPTWVRAERKLKR